MLFGMKPFVVRTKLFAAVLTLLTFGMLNSYAQAPKIIYATPFSYTVGTGVAPRSPTNTGGVVPPKMPVLASGLHSPADLTVDAAGNIYFVDNSNNVKKIPASGGAPVIVGSGFSTPAGIAADAAGNIYVADFNNSAIKKIPVAGGAIVTLGSGFSFPSSIAVDISNNVYVNDYGHKSIKEIQAGNGIPIVLATGFTFPGNIAVDAAANVYVVDGDTIKKIAAGTNAVTTFRNGGAFNDIAFDPAGNAFLADQGSSSIIEVSTGGIDLPVGSGFKNPVGVALDAHGNLYVSDNLNNTISAINKNAGYVITPTLPFGLYFDINTGIISGTPLTPLPATNFTITATNPAGSATATVNIGIKPTKAPIISYNSPHSYTVGVAISALSAVNTGGALPSPAPLTWPGSFVDANAVTVDNSGNIYVADLLNPGIWELPAGGDTVLNLGSGIDHPTGVAVDNSGNIYVSDDLDGNVKKILAGNNGTITIATGLGPLYGIALDGKGYMYVTVAEASKVEKIPVAGGAAKVVGSGFNFPQGIAVDAAGNVYVADSNNNAVKKILASNGSTVTLSGSADSPYSVAVDAEGNVYYSSQHIFQIPAGGGSTIKLPYAYSNLLNTEFCIAVDKFDNVYYGIDAENSSVKEIRVGRYEVSPALPAGLSLNAATGVITGTPTAVAPAANYTVTAQNNGGRSSATINLKVVSPNNNLSYLGMSAGALSPAFAGPNTNYTASVGNSVTSLTVTPTTVNAAATIRVDGVPVASNAVSSPIPLSVGLNTISIVVTAPDGVNTQTYTINVTRAPSTNANLSSIGPSIAPLTPTFAAGTTSYSLSVSNSTASITVKPVTSDPAATIKVNGTTLASGTTSAPIVLAEGKTTAINIAVTAQDGTTNKQYTLTVTRGPSTNASLAGMNPSISPLTPVFATATTSYTLNVDNTKTSMTIRPVGSDAHSTIKVNGTLLAYGATSAPIALAVGSNIISVLVTAQDGTTTKTYTITVTRAAGPIANFDDAISVTKPTETATLAEDGILVHQGISPNGDGVNDFLQIENINQCPDNKLTIMNRNGQMIYEAKGYDNSTKVFDGHSNKNGQMQIPGTYFYQFDYTVKGIVKHKTGFIVLKY